jgi:hypothetical protein
VKSLVRAILIFVVVVAILLLLGLAANMLPNLGSRARQRENKEEFMQKYFVGTEEN